MKEVILTPQNGKAEARRTNPQWLRNAFQDYPEVIKIDVETGRYACSPVIILDRIIGS